MVGAGGQQPVYGDVAVRLKNLRVTEIKTLLSECMLPLTGTKAVLLERLNKFCEHLTACEKEGIFRLLHVEDSNVNEKNPVTLPHHLGPLTLVSGGEGSLDGRIPLSYEAVRRYPVGDNLVVTFHYLRCYPAQSHASELDANVVSQVSIDTAKGVRTFQSPDPSAAFYTALKRFLEDYEGISVKERDSMLRQAYQISSRGLGRRLAGLDTDTNCGKRVLRAADRQHNAGCFRGTAADVACLNRFAHLSKYNALVVLPPDHKGPYRAPQQPRAISLKPWEAPASVAPLTQPSGDILKPVLEEYFPLWECREDSILIKPMPIEGGSGRFTIERRPKPDDKDKYFFLFLKRKVDGSLELDGFPHKLKVHLNDSVLSIPAKFERVDISKQVKHDVNTLRTEVTVAVDTPTNYFSVLKLYPKPVDDLIEKLKMECKLDKKNAIESLQKFLGDDDDELAADRATVQVSCPISRMRIVTPARGSACTHMQCFDLRWFLTVFENSKHQRRCTVCAKPIPSVKDLVVDGLLVDILREIEQDEGILSIHLQRGGSWSVAERDDEDEAPQATGRVKNEGESAVEDVDDGDEEEGNKGPEKREREENVDTEEGEGAAKRQKSSSSREPEPEVIVISDDEDEPDNDAPGSPITSEVGERDGGSFFDIGSGLGIEDGMSEYFGDGPFAGDFGGGFNFL
mmetsp:Transcript_25701/g.64687  ORF Transcript_25701/g.64687 Transcript_25701/m.64687 type:complete len:684 (-) Transcript_25701:2919-4970(-)